MKKKFIIASLCAVCASAFAFSACGGSGDGLSGYVDGMKKSADGAVSVNAKVELIDEGVPVYVFNRLIQVDLQTKTASVADSRTEDNNFHVVCGQRERKRDSGAEPQRKPCFRI